MCKTKQKNVGQGAKLLSNIPGEQLYVNVGFIATASTRGSMFWCLHVDKTTKMKWSFPWKEKSQVSNIIGIFLKNSKA